MSKLNCLLIYVIKDSGMTTRYPKPNDAKIKD